MNDIPEPPPHDLSVALNALNLTSDELACLAMFARREMNRQISGYTQHPDRVERARLLARWRDISNALNPNPWGLGPVKNATG